MRNNLILAAAVAATFAGVSASASTVDIYVSGSSALQTFFQKDLAVSICGQAATAISSSNISVSYKDTTLASTAGQPGYTYYSCVANGTVSGFASGNIYALHYASDLGSTWGVAGSITPSLTRETILTNVGCGTSTCNDTAHFDRVNDKSAALEAAYVMGQHKSDILTFDVEPTLFSGDNWPSANSDVTIIPAKLATAPTAAQLAGITTSNMNEQIFGVIVSNNTPGVGLSTGNATGSTSTQAPSLSTNSIRAIFTGQYTYWNQVPEVGSADTASTQIVLCRRDHGSGSEIAASLTFTGVECGVNSNAIATTASSGNLNGVIENPTSQDVKNCVQSTSSVSGLSGAVAGIGLVGIGFSASYTTVNIDGYQANAHNVAAGLYNMAYESHAKDNTANSGASADTKAVVSALLLDATKQAKLTNFYSETATQLAAAASNQFNVASTPAGYTALQAGNTASVIGSSFISNKTPVVLFDRGGNSCTAKSNSN